MCHAKKVLRYSLLGRQACDVWRVSGTNLEQYSETISGKSPCVRLVRSCLISDQKASMPPDKVLQINHEPKTPVRTKAFGTGVQIERISQLLFTVWMQKWAEWTVHHQHRFTA